MKKNYLLEIDPKIIGMMIKLGLSNEVIAGYHGMSLTKFESAIKDHPDICQALSNRQS